MAAGRWILCAIAAAVGFTASPGRAEDPPTDPNAKAAAREELEKARGLVRDATMRARVRRFDDAIERYRSAIEILRREVGETTETASALAGLGRALREVGRPQLALPVNEEALAMYRRLSPIDRPTVAACLLNLAGTYQDLGDPARALRLNEEGLAMYREIYPGDHQNVATSLSNIALALARLGRPTEALPLVEEALAMYRRLFPGDHPRVASGLLNVAANYAELGRHADALPLEQEALAMRRRLYLGDHPPIATSLDNLAGTLSALGRHADALLLRREALAMRRRLFPADHPDVAISLNSLGQTLGALGRDADALPLREEALAMYRRLFAGDHPGVAVSLANLASTYDRLGRPMEALPLEEEALAMRRRLFGDDHPSIAQSLYNLSRTYDTLGRQEDALAGMRAAAEMAERTGWAERHVPLTGLGGFLLDRRQPEEAIPPLLAAIEHLEGLRSEAKALGAFERGEYVATMRRRDPFPLMIEAQIALGRPADALGFLERGRAREMLDLLERGQIDPLERARERERAAGAVGAPSRIDEARVKVARAESEVTQREREEGRARSGGDRARIREALDAASKARRALLGSLADQARLVRDVLPEASARTPGEVQAMLAADERMLVYSLGERESFVLLVSPAPAGIRAFALREGDRPLTLDRVATWIPEHVASLATSAPATVSMDPFRALVPEEVWKEVRGASRLYVVGHGAVYALPFEALVVGEKDHRPVYWLDEGPPIAYVASGSVLSWLRARHDEQREGAGALSLVAVGDPVFAGTDAAPAWPDSGVLVRSVRPDGQAAKLGLRPGDVLTSYGERPLVDAAGFLEAIEAARESQGVAVHLRRGGVDLTVRVPPGSLGIDVALEPPPVAGPKLLDDGQIGIAVRSARQRGRQLLRLPATRQEVEGIRRGFLENGAEPSRVRVLLGPEATEARLMETVSGARYLHLATHGLADETETASFSSLALTMPMVPVPGDDGFLTLLDLLGRWRDKLEDTQLVVLSACDTQRGMLQNDEGVYALPWGFHFAGCPTVVATLWAVDDRSTAALMEDFYRHLLAKNGADKLGALVDAKKTLRRKHPEPFYWAPFVMLGDPR